MLDYNIYLDTPITCFRLDSCIGKYHAYLYRKLPSYDPYTVAFDYNSYDYTNRTKCPWTPGSHPNAHLYLYADDHRALEKLYREAYVINERDIEPYKFNKIISRNPVLSPTDERITITSSNAPLSVYVAPTKQKRYRPCHY